MLSVTVYTCMAIGFILLIANILVFYAVLKKKQYSTVDHLVGAICIHGQLYYVLASLVALAIYYLPKKLNNSRAFLDYFQDWVACYFGLSFTTLLTMFYVDRYLATARPLFYKMKVRNRFGRIAIAISVCAALLLASLLVIVQFFSSHLVRARHSFFVCLNTFTFVCFIGMLLSYTLICRSLLYFAGRQMYIFGNSETRASSTVTTTTTQTTRTRGTVKNTNAVDYSMKSDVVNTNPKIVLEISKSAVSAAGGRVHRTQYQQQKQHKSKSIKMKKLSLPAFSANSTTATTATSSVSFNTSKRLSTVRSARFSCPDSMVSEKGPPDLPLWLIAMLSKEIETLDRQKQPDTLTHSSVNKMLPMQNFPMRRRAAIYNPSKGRGRERGYTITNVVSNLISSSRRQEFDKELRLSQVRNLVKILTTSLLLYLMFWSPFIVSVFD